MFFKDIGTQIEKFFHFNLLKNNYLINISQEFRTTLTAIRGFTEILLKSKNLNYTQHKDLKIIFKNAVRLEHVVHQVERIISKYRDSSSKKKEK